MRAFRLSEDESSLNDSMLRGGAMAVGQVRGNTGLGAQHQGSVCLCAASGQRVLVRSSMCLPLCNRLCEGEAAEAVRFVIRFGEMTRQITQIRSKLITLLRRRLGTRGVAEGTIPCR